MGSALRGLAVCRRPPLCDFCKTDTPVLQCGPPLLNISMHLVLTLFRSDAIKWGWSHRHGRYLKEAAKYDLPKTTDGMSIAL